MMAYNGMVSRRVEALKAAVRSDNWEEVSRHADRLVRMARAEGHLNPAIDNWITDAIRSAQS